MGLDVVAASVGSPHQKTRMYASFVLVESLMIVRFLMARAMVAEADVEVTEMLGEPSTSECAWPARERLARIASTARRVVKWTSSLRFFDQDLNPAVAGIDAPWLRANLAQSGELGAALRYGLVGRMHLQPEMGHGLPVLAAQPGRPDHRGAVRGRDGRVNVQVGRQGLRGLRGYQVVPAVRIPESGDPPTSPQSAGLNLRRSNFR